MEMRRYFKVQVTKYVKDRDFFVYRPASLKNPKDHAVMFIQEEYISHADVFTHCKNCLIFWPKGIEVSKEISESHAVVICENPHKSYCLFYRENQIRYLPELEKYRFKDGVCIADGAVIGNNVRIFPGTYIGSEVVIGNDVYIGSGVKIVGRVTIGSRVIIRENTVIGADGLSTDRDEWGKAITMPQFGGVVIEDDVEIGALTTIARGAIDDTVIKKGSKIDNSCFISHNVQIGEDTFIVGESIMFGSSSTGRRAFISGNAAIREGRHVGDGSKVGMGAVVVKDVKDGQIVKGNPAR